MNKLIAASVFAIAVVASVGASSQSSHQQHQSGAAPAAPAPAAPGGTPAAGMPMMQNMPESCRAAMQAMPPSCMGAMQQMMQGGAMGRGGAGGYAQHGATPSAAAQPAFTKAYVEAMDKMHGPMMEGVMAPNADVAFVRGMIPHHQGAIDMARIVLQHGGDEQVKKWAVDVIREQQREIGEMEAWLAKNAK